MSGWELHPAKSSFGRYAADWDRLNAVLYQGHPYYDSRFVGALLDHFASGREQLCLYRRNDRVEAALIVEPHGVLRWRSFRPAQAQATALLLPDASLLGPLLEALPGLVWCLDLLAVDPTYAPDFRNARLSSLVAAHAETISVGPSLRFEDYWRSRAKNLRHSLRQARNRVEKDFLASGMRRSTDPAEMRSGIVRFAALESAGWKGAAGTAVAADNAQGAFYSEVMSRFAATGQATIYELQVDGRIASSQLVIENDRMSVLLKIAYDEELQRIRPGWLLLRHCIEDMMTRRPERCIEFYTCASREQKGWATSDRTMQNLSIFRSALHVELFSVLKGVLHRVRAGRSGRHGEERHTDRISFGVATDVDSLAKAGSNVEDYRSSDVIDLSLDWFALLHRHVYRNDPGVRYYFVADNDCLTAILPLRISKCAGVKTIDGLSNYYTSLYSPLAVPASNWLRLRFLLMSACAELGGAHVMRFTPMDPQSDAYHGLLNELRAIGWVPFNFFRFGNWYLDVPGDWNVYLGSRSANLRSAIKRRTREFVAAGGQLEVVTGNCAQELLEQAILDYQQVYAASWKQPEPFVEFVPSLIRYLAVKDMLRLGIARLHGKPVAAEIWSVTAGKASIFKLAYDEAFASHSPGTVLTGHLLRHVIEVDRVHEVDYLQGDETYKRAWMSDRRERHGIVAYNPATLIGCLMLLREVLARAVRRARARIRPVSGQDPGAGSVPVAGSRRGFRQGPSPKIIP